MTGFRFKKFEILQDRCAMKVGTDGVLLGAWASGGTRILDIGCGTGLIALMMAQRFPAAQVVGIDIDEEACGQARENVAASPFGNPDIQASDTKYSLTSEGSTTEKTPFSESKRFTPCQRSLNGKVSACRAIALLLSGFFKLFRKNGGLLTITEIMMNQDGNRSEWYAKITDEFYL